MFRVEHYQTPDGLDIVGDWLDGLTDHQAVARIAARLVRLELGNFGDCKTVNNSVWELRIDWGAGYRIYYAQAGLELNDPRQSRGLSFVSPSKGHSAGAA